MTGDAHPRVFFDLPHDRSDPEQAAVAILPVPYDGTASWLRGSAGGPGAILEASQYVEVWDLETGSEPWRAGIATLTPVDVGGAQEDPGQEPSPATPEVVIRRVEEQVARILDRDQLPVVLGGEHSVTLGAVRALAARTRSGSPPTVVQVDAHADTRESYHGSRFNHACVMARVRELCPIVQVGIRSADSSEISGLDPERVFWAHEIVPAADRSWIDRVVGLCSDDVFVTIDVDGFDPSIVPATGTPEPGGLDWYQVTDLLAALARHRRVVGFDVVELIGGHPPSAFTAAKLVYRFLAEILAVRRSGDSQQR